MSNLQDFLPFVNDQIEFQNKMIQKFSSEEYRKNFHTLNRDKFIQLASSIERTLEELNKHKLEIENQRNVTLKAKQGLPSLTSVILSLIEESGGIISVDRLLVGFYKKTKEIQKRSQIISRLSRMSQKKMVFSIPGKKGWYSLNPLTKKEVEEITN